MKSPFLLTKSTTLGTLRLSAIVTIWHLLLLRPASGALYETMLREQQAERQARQYLKSRQLNDLTPRDTNSSFPADFDFDTEELIVPSNQIFNGMEAEKGEFPWFVELFAVPFDSEFDFIRRCGGAMISGDLVLTAANCLFDLRGDLADRLQSFAIIKRENNVRVGRGIYRTWKVTRPHPDHQFPGLVANVAVIQISGVKLFPEYDIGIIQTDTGQPAQGAELTGMGYGTGIITRGVEGVTEKLTFANFTVANRGTFCPIPDNTNFFCLNTTLFFDEDDRADFCGGDEGAPIVLGDPKLGYQTLFGIYTGVPGWCRGGPGGNYAIVVRTATYSTWIHETACDMANARCLESCALLRAGTGVVSDSIQIVGGYIDNVWRYFTGREPSSHSDELPDEEPLGGGGGGGLRN